MRGKHVQRIMKSIRHLLLTTICGLLLLFALSPASARAETPAFTVAVFVCPLLQDSVLLHVEVGIPSGVDRPAGNVIHHIIA